MSPPLQNAPTDLTVRTRWKAAGKFFRNGETGETVFVKAVTWGPFPSAQAPDPDIELPRVCEELGANALRLYEIPDRAFLDACAAHGLRVFLTIPWSQDIDFTDDRRLIWDIRKQVRETVARFRGHPAVAGWFVGNEIPAPLVRWIGPARVNRILESLIRTGRQADPEALFSYANYPSTEYLSPRDQDFFSFNLYLEDRAEFASYLCRLQNLAGDKPLLLSEFGLDSGSHGSEVQAGGLAWHVEETARAGLAGTTLFAWSDLWERGGSTVEDWDFGLVRRDGTAKPALEKVALTWKAWKSPADALTGATPRISVIVCTYRGTRTLRACLESLKRLRYPDFEAIVVNDGGDGAVAGIVADFPTIRHVPLIPHGGLSAARNLGAAEADGEILAYTDDDCEVDPDWLRWLAAVFVDSRFSAAGGPNIPPPSSGFFPACVAAAPGGPAHVLLSDRDAEHVPGCNLAVRRDAFDAIGGFNERFRTAGDDVDFCWRLLDGGHRIGFHAGAMVWHHQRFFLGAYFRQQIGYGRAEADLVPLHPGRFGTFGGARWNGWIYAPVATIPDGMTRIYQGIFGYAPYQMIYGRGGSALGHFVSSWGAWLLAAILLLGGWVAPVFAIFGFGVLALSVGHAIRTARRATIEPRHEGWRARCVVFWLALGQPVVRGLRRSLGSLRHARPPREVPIATDHRPIFMPRLPQWRRRRSESYWSDQGGDRDALLGAFLRRSRTARLSPGTGDGWEDWDVELPVSIWWSIHLTTMTEYHAKEGRLTRTRIEAGPTMPTVLLRIALALWAAALATGRFQETSPWWFAALGALFLAPEAIRLHWFSLAGRLLRESAAEAGMTPLPR